MDNSIYSEAVRGKPKNPQIDNEALEQERQLKENAARQHREWLEHPITQQFLAETKKTLNTIFDVSIQCAYSGKNEEAIRNLIKARAFKEVINYARRNEDNDNGNS